jgi:hypothetical protein
MTRAATRILVFAVLGLALLGAGFAAMPPAGQRLPASSIGDPPVRGAIHVHTVRSDGTGTVDDVAAAAARAGLSFVVLTDHGNATLKLAEPRYLHGVLCIDAVEISSRGGHIVAVGLPQSPYPLGGEPRDVVEDVLRLGGMPIAAHPGSAKPELQWTDWDAPIDGLEWLNGDSEWRDESYASLARALFTYPFRQSETLTALLDRPEPLLRRWDELTRHRKVVALAAADAHARIGLRADVGDSPGAGGSLRVPGYERVFRAFSVALPGVMLTKNAEADAKSVVDAIRNGRVFSSLDGVAQPSVLSFSASSGTHSANAGDTLMLDGPVAVRVETNAPADASIQLFENGSVVATANGSRLEHTAAGKPGVFRVEVYLPAAPGNPPAPWLVSNPIYAGEPVPQAVTPRPAPTTSTLHWAGGDTTGWAIEASARSKGRFEVVDAVEGSQLSFEYALGGVLSEGPFVALAMAAGTSLPRHDRLVFSARADKPMRVDVQLRSAERGGARWRRSVYLDSTPRDIAVFFDEMKPIAPNTESPATLGGIDTVLFVLDSANTSLGVNGRIWLDDIRFAR